MIINSKHRFIFYHVPKNGGTSIRSALTLKPGFEPGWIVNAHETPSELHKRLPECKDWYQCAMLRTPWSRIWSQYHHAKAVRFIPEDMEFTDFIPLCAKGGPPFMRQQREYQGRGVRWYRFPYFSSAIRDL